MAGEDNVQWDLKLLANHNTRMKSIGLHLLAGTEGSYPSGCGQHSTCWDFFGSSSQQMMRKASPTSHVPKGRGIPELSDIFTTETVPMMYELDLNKH